MINAAEEHGFYQDLLRYLAMARTESKVKESAIDTEYVYACAKTNRLANLEEFMGTPNVALWGGLLPPPPPPLHQVTHGGLACWSQSR